MDAPPCTAGLRRASPLESVWTSHALTWLYCQHSRVLGFHDKWVHEKLSSQDRTHEAYESMVPRPGHRDE